MTRKKTSPEECLNEIFKSYMDGSYGKVQVNIASRVDALKYAKDNGVMTIQFLGEILDKKYASTHHPDLSSDRKLFSVNPTVLYPYLKFCIEQSDSGFLEEILLNQKNDQLKCTPKPSVIADALILDYPVAEPPSIFSLIKEPEKLSIVLKGIFSQEEMSRALRSIELCKNSPNDQEAYLFLKKVEEKILSLEDKKLKSVGQHMLTSISKHHSYTNTLVKMDNAITLCTSSAQDDKTLKESMMKIKADFLKAATQTERDNLSDRFLGELAKKIVNEYEGTSKGFFKRTSPESQKIIAALKDLKSQPGKDHSTEITEILNSTKYEGRLHNILVKYGIREYSDPAVAQFFKDYPVKSSSYWAGKDLSTVTVQDLIHHAVGWHKINGKSGESTKQALIKYGVPAEKLTFEAVKKPTADEVSALILRKAEHMVKFAP